MYCIAKIGLFFFWRAAMFAILFIASFPLRLLFLAWIPKYSKYIFCCYRHLRIAQELYDKVGEGRACWSLGNAHSSMGQHTEAYYYAKRHLEISRDTGDRMGQATAQLNLTDLCRTLGYTPPDINELPHEKNNIEVVEAAAMAATSSNNADIKKSRRSSMEHMDLIKMTPDPKKVHAAKTSEDKENNSSLNKSGLLDEEDFFDFITRFQSKRMDDQRCSLTVPSMKGINHRQFHYCFIQNYYPYDNMHCFIEKEVWEKTSRIIEKFSCRM